MVPPFAYEHYSSSEINLLVYNTRMYGHTLLYAYLWFIWNGPQTHTEYENDNWAFEANRLSSFPFGMDTFL